MLIDLALTFHPDSHSYCIKWPLSAIISLFAHGFITYNSDQLIDYGFDELVAAYPMNDGSVGDNDRGCDWCLFSDRLWVIQFILYFDWNWRHCLCDLSQRVVLGFLVLDTIFGKNSIQLKVVVPEGFELLRAAHQCSIFRFLPNDFLQHSNRSWNIPPPKKKSISQSFRFRVFSTDFRALQFGNFWLLQISCRVVLMRFRKNYQQEITLE